MRFTKLPEYRPGNRLVSGSTRSGKSFAEVIEILIAAMVGVMTGTSKMGIVVIDPHVNSLVWNVFKYLVAYGQSGRVLYDRLSSFSRVLGYRFLKPSNARNPFKREAENDQTVKEFFDILLRRKDVQSLASNPLTEEHAGDGLSLVINQEQPVADSAFQYSYSPETEQFAQLLSGCTSERLRQKFLAVADGRIKPGTCASAKRLFQSVCTPAFTIRCHKSFGLGGFLDDSGILLVEGDTESISQDAANTVMGGIALQVIQYVRSRRRPVPRVLLVLDEATNANLIGAAGHEVRAMAELQKKGLDVHVLVQSPNFPNSFIEDAILTNTIEHHWYYAANDAVARKAAADLGDPSYRDRVRALHRGERFIKRLNRVSFGKVEGLPDPWAFPGLTERKARVALSQILKRPEYWSPTCDTSDNRKTKASSRRSSSSQSSTSPSSPTSSDLGAAERLRIARSTGSEKNDDSAPPDES